MNSNIIRFPRVVEKTGLPRGTIYREIADGRFPKPMKLAKRAVGWREEVIDAWLAERESNAKANAN
jgi:prophage regulatory protein